MSDSQQTGQAQSSSNRILRPEARPFSWAQLHDSQRDAFERILAAMAEAVAQLKKRSERDRRPLARQDVFLAKEKTNQVLLLSGERGTGKTSVLLTIQAALTDPEWEAAESVRVEGSVEGTFQVASPAAHGVCEVRGSATMFPFRLAAGKAGDMNSACRNDLYHLRNSQVKWLEPLDMEPLPQGTNLLASILARIESALDADCEEAIQSMGILGPHSGVENALHNLHRLATDVALAWDGNIRQRAGAMDPDSFASEVMRVERARLSLNRKLNEALDELARGLYRREEGRSLLFVLPVDDLDLNPLRCLELLRLLRAISVPRLFVLVLGRVGDAEAVARLDIAGGLAELGRNSLASQVFGEADLPAMSQRVAVNTVRKLLPPAQRIHLKLWTPEEALGYCPPEGKDTIESLLAQCKLGTSGSGQAKAVGAVATPKTNWGELLRAQTVNWAEYRQLSLPIHAVREFLTGPTREIMDLWFALHESIASRRDPSETLALLAARMLRDSIAADPALTYAERQRLERSIEIRPDGTLRLDTSDLATDCDTAWHSSVPTQGRPTTIELRQHKRWAIRLEPSGSEGEQGRGQAPRPPGRVSFLCDRSSELVQLLHDLLGPTRPDKVVRRSPAPQLQHGRYATATWAFPTNKVVRVPWIGLPLQDFWECDAFTSDWNSHLQKIPTLGSGAEGTKDVAAHEKVMGYLGIYWIAAGTALLRDDTPVSNEVYPPQPDVIRKILEQVNELAKKACPRAGTLAQGDGGREGEWLRRLALLLAPESGLPAEIARAIVPDKDRQRGVAVQAGAAAFSSGNEQKPVDGGEDLLNFWQHPDTADLVRRERAALVAPAWDSNGFNGFWSLVNPKEFQSEVRTALGQDQEVERLVNEAEAARTQGEAATDQAAPGGPGRSARELLDQLRGEPTSQNWSEYSFTNLLELLRPLLPNSEKRGWGAEYAVQRLGGAAACVDVFHANSDHPINKFADGCLCPTRGDLHRLTRHSEQR
jgi:hypothetical protein